VVGVDHELRGWVVDVGDVGLEASHAAGLGLQLAVDRLLCVDELDEPVALDRLLTGDGLLGLGDLLIDPAQGAAGSVGLVLVVDDLVTPLVGGSSRPRLGEHVSVGDVGVGVVLAPCANHVRDLGDLRADDEREPGCLDGFLVRLRHHSGVGHHRDVGELVGGHERLDGGEHGLGLGLVALEGLDHQWEPGRVGEQSDGDLRLEAAFFGEPGLAEAVTLVGLEVERADVVEHQGRRPQRRVLGAGGREPLPPRVFGVDRQAAIHRGIRGRLDADLLKHPQAVLLAGRLDDPRHDQLPEHVITTGGLLETERLVGPAQRVPQTPHPRGHDLQRATNGSLGQPEVELALPGRQPLPRRRLERLQLELVMSRPQMLNRAGTAPRRVHDLHRRRSRRGLHRPHVRHGRGAYGPRLVRKFSHPEPQTRRPQRRWRRMRNPLIRVRF
jgi:hypothetical protein